MGMISSLGGFPLYESMLALKTVEEQVRKHRKKRINKSSEKTARQMEDADRARYERLKERFEKEEA